ncbi:AfsA-related hotdog domain-containing protein [Burkholderia pyrrocinia]|uniref:AfsA-related hotdog domain-containing protein n=1 Tax=Burkholderia pyrrocinia TaxID=60550 RepID=UPI0030CD5E07
MMSLKPITPDIVHKDSVHAVLIAGENHIIPVWIEEAQCVTLEEHWSVDDIDRFNAIYRKEDGFFVLKGVPLYLSRGVVESGKDFDLDLSEYYALDAGRYRIDARYLPRSVETCLRRRFFPAVVPPGEQAIAHIARLLTRSPDWNAAPMSSYRMVNDTENYFFYRKPHEHVPGLMLIEVARQSMYHYLYNFSGYERGDVSISMSRLDVRFVSYVESAYDVEVLVTQTEGVTRIKPRFIDKTASFYQNGRLVAQVHLVGGAMKVDVFRRMRVLNVPESHWFVPSSRLSIRTLIGIPGGLPIQATLTALSLRAGRLRVSQGLVNMLRTAKHISIYVEKSGFLSFPLESIETSPHEGEVTVKFGDLSREQMVALKETIKCHCFFGECAFEIGQASSSCVAELPAAQRSDVE